MLQVKKHFNGTFLDLIKMQQWVFYKKNEHQCH